MRNDDGGIDVDEQLAVDGADEVFLAGDIACLPTPWGRVRIEHWRFAQETGELAARNVLGQGLRYESTPFFCSMQQIEGSYMMTGHAESPDDSTGDVDSDDFSLAFLRDGQLSAVLAHGVDVALTTLEREMAGNGPLAAQRAPEVG